MVHIGQYWVWSPCPCLQCCIYLPRFLAALPSPLILWEGKPGLSTFLPLSHVQDFLPHQSWLLNLGFPQRPQHTCQEPGPVQNLARLSGWAMEVEKLLTSSHCFYCRQGRNSILYVMKCTLENADRWAYVKTESAVEGVSQCCLALCRPGSRQGYPCLLQLHDPQFISRWAGADDTTVLQKAQCQGVLLEAI